MGHNNFNIDRLHNPGKGDLSYKRRDRPDAGNTKSREIPIQYRVFQDRSGAWKGYDVVIENVSLVMNYRSQFNEGHTR